MPTTILAPPCTPSPKTTGTRVRGPPDPPKTQASPTTHRRSTWTRHATPTHSTSTRPATTTTDRAQPTPPPNPDPDPSPAKSATSSRLAPAAASGRVIHIHVAERSLFLAVARMIVDAGYYRARGGPG
ncbi:hypothetical protein B0I37DRAFT_409364 [Chaetomium sp. MPI-CAGE-AT-0009]|nr:hypothetical protein B0I37DRAFT_409364 [Chaetomium sp. MPI-CAGE-AT-0009]